MTHCFSMHIDTHLQSNGRTQHKFVLRFRRLTLIAFAIGKGGKQPCPNLPAQFVLFPSLQGPSLHFTFVFVLHDLEGATACR